MAKVIRSNGNIPKIGIILLVLFLFYFGVGQYILDVKYTTDDDLFFSSSSYGDWIEFAKNQGRVVHYINGFMVKIPYLYSNQFYYLSVHFGSLVIMALSLITMIKVVSKDNYLTALYSILFFVLWQNSHGHNLMVSYPFYIVFFIITFSLSIILFTLFLDSKKNKHLFLSLFFWILTIKGGEFWLMYFPLFFVIAYSRSSIEIFKEKVKYSVRKLKYHSYAVFISTSVYFIFKWQADNFYKGNIINADVINILHSWFIYTAGLFPGYQFYLNVDKIGLDVFLNLIDLKIVFISLVVLWLLIAARSYFFLSNINKKKYLLIGVLFSFFPTFLISLSGKYQSWALHHNVSDYLFSSFSYFAIIFIFVIILATVKSKVHYILLSIFISTLVFSTQLNNKYIGSQQSDWAERFFLLNAFLQTEYAKDGVIASPTLWSNKIFSGKGRENSLSKYAKYNSGKDIEILKAGDNTPTLKYFKTRNNKSSFLTYSENNKLKAIFLSSKKCNKKKRCYLLSVHTSINGSIMYNSFVVDDLAYKYQIISTPDSKNVYGVNVYYINDDIEDDQIIMLLEYDPKLKTQKIVDFNKGFYSIEGGGNERWIWAFDNGRVGIQSLENIKVKLTVSLRVASKRIIQFKLNDKDKKVEFKDDKPREVIFFVNLHKGNNDLEILSNIQPIKLSKEDDRVFSYAIFDISIADIGSIE